MVFVISGYKIGKPKTSDNRRLFLYQKDDFEDFCMQTEALMDTPYESRACIRKKIDTGEIEIGDACVLRILHYMPDGSVISKENLEETIKLVSRHKIMLYRANLFHPQYEYDYQEIPEKMLLSVDI